MQPEPDVDLDDVYATPRLDRALQHLRRVHPEQKPNARRGRRAEVFTQTLRRPRRADLAVIQRVVRKTRGVVPTPAPAAGLAARQEKRKQNDDEERSRDLPQRPDAGVRHHPLDVHLAHEVGLLLEHLPTLEAGVRAGRGAAAFTSLVVAIRVLDDHAAGLGVRGAVRRRAQVHLHRVEHDLARERLERLAQPRDGLAHFEARRSARIAFSRGEHTRSFRNQSAHLPKGDRNRRCDFPVFFSDATPLPRTLDGLCGGGDTRPRFRARLDSRRRDRDRWAVRCRVASTR